ncbi:general transcription factor II-I repeat domain-containing protein 1-like [Mytilus californianus]|uniref:general transcription factor II-I repeat domain-containing protein 1-like n=1 Tax=Mytilus californianus TaxID=6549 RepID=UPI002247F04E|nr:general transcription factor II-I repeat domain-containing protein 1-like [Mytilus californianus]
MEGLPDGVIFKDPNSYGLSTLRQIISQKESIKFVNVTPASTLASSATSSKELENGNITDVTDAPAIPLELREVPMEEVADALDITIELENGNITDVTDAPAIPLDLSNMHMEEITGAPEIPLDVLDSLAATIHGDAVEEQTSVIIPKEEEESNDMYKVSSLLAKKKIGRKQFFLVHWEGYESSEATWEPRKNIPNYFIKSFLR